MQIMEQAQEVVVVPAPKPMDTHRFADDDDEGRKGTGIGKDVGRERRNQLAAEHVHAAEGAAVGSQDTND